MPVDMRYSEQSFEVGEEVKAVSKSIGARSFNPDIILRVSKFYTREQAIRRLNTMRSINMIYEIESKPWIHHVISISGNYYLPEDLRKVSEEATTNEASEQPQAVQREFQIGDHVTIRSKSIGCTYENYRTNHSENLNNQIIVQKLRKRDVVISYIETQNLSDEDFIYAICGNYFLAQDLILEVDAPRLSVGDRVVPIGKSIGINFEEYRRNCNIRIDETTISRIITREELVNSFGGTQRIENIINNEPIYMIQGQFFLERDLTTVQEVINNPENILTTERRNVTMDWRSVQSDELTGKRVKCTWQTNGTLECTHSHIFTGFVGEVETKQMIIQPTGSQLAKRVLIGKDAEGWLIIRSATTHVSRRGTEQKVFYQAICPEHIAEYELQLAEDEAAERIRQARIEAEERQRREAQESTRRIEAEAQARRDAERQEREAQRQAEEQAREEQRRLNAEKYNIWSYHEKGNIE